MYMEALAEHYHFSLDTPIRDLSPELVDILLYGTKGEKIKVHRKSEYGRGTYETEFEGIINNLERRFRDTSSSWIKEEIESYMSAVRRMRRQASFQGESCRDGGRQEYQ